MPTNSPLLNPGQFSVYFPCSLTQFSKAPTLISITQFESERVDQLLETNDWKDKEKK